MDIPEDFRCPISMELMKDPVTICTGITYESNNIQKWFNTCMKKTCPATMQSIDNFDMTPNYTLKRLIKTWKDSKSHSIESSIKHDELVSLIIKIDSTPFKVNYLRKLGKILEIGDDEIEADFKRLKGVELLIKIVVQILVESSDFDAFRACEEAIAVLHKLSLSEEDEKLLELLTTPECVKSMAFLLQKGSAEARFCSVSLLRNMVKARSSNYQWNSFVQDQGTDFFKSLFEVISDEIRSKASSCALQVLIALLETSKKCRLKAIEAGAICTLIELFSDSNKAKCEKIIYLMGLLCECAEGRLAFVEHGLGVAAVSKKLLNVSNAVTKVGVKILWLICSYHPTEKVLEDMLVFGAAMKLVALLYIGGHSSTKERVMKILKLHGNSWERFPCFQREKQAYLGLATDFC